jgi:hypothetical protein
MLFIADYQWLIEWIECRGERLETFGRVKTFGLRRVLREFDAGGTEFLWLLDCF